MDRQKFLKPLILLMFFMFAANSVAQKFYLYSSVWYFDMPMHFFGGLWEGWLFLWFFSIEDMPSIFRISLDRINLKIICQTILFVLLIGVFWEIFEFIVFNHIGRDPFNILDTISDISFDLAGGSFSVFYFLRKNMLQLKDGPWGNSLKDRP